MKVLIEKILNCLAETDGVTSTHLAFKIGEEDHQKVVGAIKSVQSWGTVIQTEQRTQSKLEITPEGKDVQQYGSPEVMVFNEVPSGSDGIDSKLLAKRASDAETTSYKIGLNQAVKRGWLKVVKMSGGSTSNVVRIIDEQYIVDQTRNDLQAFSEGNDVIPQEVINDLKKRKLIASSILTYFIVWRSTDFSLDIVKQEAELTAEMMNSGEYQQKTFKPYNFNALGASIDGGQLHPLQKVRRECVQILTEMGFSEMPTNCFVESSFWNFDALFVAQNHPARDLQDTFFVSRPEFCKSQQNEYIERVKVVHSVGSYGSMGHQSPWREDQSRKNVMRTHTTAISSRVLHQLAQDKEFKPYKRFTIDRVFRNEKLDATHLAEFHQVEGFVVDRDLTLGHLIGLMKEFFRRLGIHEVKFKPVYNPYTEPSMEAFAYHPGLKKWVEVGNSGMFRPEVLLPMGYPENVKVVAWGISLERPTMIKYGIQNIRSLMGPKVDLHMVQNSPLYRIDKNKHCLQ